jgi:(p)ppGpp synthase/HD superfamily hydrolase
MRYFLATLFAQFAHRKQKRKYTGEPYYVHLEEVAGLVQTAKDVDVNMIIAALLHDAVEDTWVPLWLVRVLFGSDVAGLVSDLTDASRPEDGNRAVRKAIDRAHSAAASARAQTVKLADLLSNTRSITLHDAKFAKVYMAEKELLLALLTKGDRVLYARCVGAMVVWKRCNTA